MKKRRNKTVMTCVALNLLDNDLQPRTAMSKSSKDSKSLNVYVSVIEYDLVNSDLDRNRLNIKFRDAVKGALKRAGVLGLSKNGKKKEEEGDKGNKGKIVVKTRVRCLQISTYDEFDIDNIVDFDSYNWSGIADLQREKFPDICDKRLVGISIIFEFK